MELLGLFEFDKLGMGSGKLMKLEYACRNRTYSGLEIHTLTKLDVKL